MFLIYNKYRSYLPIVKFGKYIVIMANITFIFGVIYIRATKLCVSWMELKVQVVMLHLNLKIAHYLCQKRSTSYYAPNLLSLYLLNWFMLLACLGYIFRVNLLVGNANDDACKLYLSRTSDFVDGVWVVIVRPYNALYSIIYLEKTEALLKLWHEA